jgi:DNA-binding MarR family transcriptional regulator
MLSMLRYTDMQQAPKGIRAVVQPIMRLAFSIEKIADRKLRAERGLTISQFRMLMVVRKMKVASQRDIAEFWGVAEASVSRQMEPLIALKLIERKRDPGNRRANALALTARGKEALDAALDALDAELEAAFAEFPKEARPALAEALMRLHDAFQHGCEDHKEKAPARRAER